VHQCIDIFLQLIISDKILNQVSKAKKSTLFKYYGH